MKKSGILQKIRSSYLNPDGADVWFVFDGDRVPGHKFVLTTTSPWLNTMFNGSLPETEDVDMTDSQVSVAAFIEFLQFFYMDDITLTMNNIEGVIHLAKQSLTNEIFAKCEQFLIESLTLDKMFYGLQLALLYEANALRAFCEEEICINAESTLKSSSFLDFPYSHLQYVLKCDSLACEEKDIFNACIAWAKAEAKRNHQDSISGEILRSHLRDSLYQIRFCSMTVEEVAECFRSCLGLFSVAELEEIMFMLSRTSYSQATKFNWTPRYYSPKLNRADRQMVCSRYGNFDFPIGVWSVKSIERNIFTCNRRVILNGFYCECTNMGTEAVTVTITEAKSTSVTTERYKQQNQTFSNKTVRECIYPVGAGYFRVALYKGYIELTKPILLRPDYAYVIAVEIDNCENKSIVNYGGATSVRRIDHDILIRFYGTGIITQLSLSRFDRKAYLRKIVHNPKTWILASLAMAIGGSYLYFFRNQPQVSAPKHIKLPFRLFRLR